MGDACEEIGRTLSHIDRELYPEWFEKERRQLEDVFFLLDLIGWPADGEVYEVAVDLRERGQTLKDALASYLPQIEEEHKEADTNDGYRAEEGKAPQKKQIIKRVTAYRELIVLVEHSLPESA